MYLSEYQHLFINKTKDNFGKATQYVEGLALSDLKNIERITETLNSDYHKMQHFITESNWDARAVIDQIAKQVDRSLPKEKLKGLLIDESGWIKKGRQKCRRRASVLRQRWQDSKFASSGLRLFVHRQIFGTGRCQVVPAQVMVQQRW